VVLSAVFAYAFDWESKGVEILGEVKSSTGSAFPFHWPFVPKHMIHVREAMSTSFLIALLGFFESSVAAKALGGGEAKKQGDEIKGMALSANRELIALGVANLVGGCFMALPAFGGYGRSKVNASTGGKTPMSSIFLSIITILCVLFLLPYFYFLPVSVLLTSIFFRIASLIAANYRKAFSPPWLQSWLILSSKNALTTSDSLYAYAVGLSSFSWGSSSPRLFSILYRWVSLWAWVSPSYQSYATLRNHASRF
jgi:MFS superfamily sulfate permease-like transporter